MDTRRPGRFRPCLRCRPELAHAYLTHLRLRQALSRVLEDAGRNGGA